MYPRAISDGEISAIQKELETDNETAAALALQLQPAVLEAVGHVLQDEAVALATGFFRQAPRAQVAERDLNPHVHSFELVTEPAGAWVFAWAAFQDITLEEAPMWIIPGSHRLSEELHRDIHDLLERERPGAHAKLREGFAKRPEERELGSILAEYHEAFRRRLAMEIRSPRPVLLEKGDVVLFDPALIHGTLPWRSDVERPLRLSAVTRYAGRSATLYAFAPWARNAEREERLKLPARYLQIRGREVYEDYVGTRLGLLGVRRPQ